MLKRMLRNASKPQGFWGKVLLLSMNIGHGPMARWGLNAIHFGLDEHILDIGCGGGKNIQRMLKRVPLGYVCGVDYSALCVEKSQRLNRKSIMQERTDVLQGAVSKLPFESDTFDTATAFETVYFWPDIVADMREVYRVLKPGGRFFICNEATHEDIHPDKYVFFINVIGMKVYSENELTLALKKVGYVRVKVMRHHTKTRICIVAHKPEGE